MHHACNHSLTHRETKDLLDNLKAIHREDESDQNYLNELDDTIIAEFLEKVSFCCINNPFFFVNYCMKHFLFLSNVIIDYLVY